MPLTLPFCSISSRHEVVDRLEHSACCCGHQVGKAKMSWPDLRLRLGGDGQKVLVALRGDEVDLELDLLLLGPGLARSPRSPCCRPAPSGPRSRPTGCRPRSRRARTAPRSNVDAAAVVCRKAPTRYLEFRHGFPSRWLFLPIVAARPPERAALLTGAVGVPTASCGRHVPSRSSGPASCTISGKAQSHGEPARSLWNKSAPGAFSRG